jgi:hypothetical protein
MLEIVATGLIVVVGALVVALSGRVVSTLYRGA